MRNKVFLGAQMGYSTITLQEKDRARHKYSKERESLQEYYKLCLPFTNPSQFTETAKRRDAKAFEEFTNIRQKLENPDSSHTYQELIQSCNRYGVLGRYLIRIAAVEIRCGR